MSVAGSHPGMMRRLFGDRTRPFYGQSRVVRLGPMPEDALGQYIGGRFTRTGRQVGDVLDPLLATPRGHPQRIGFDSLADRGGGECGGGSGIDERPQSRALDLAA
jgi:hypothetical protein